MNDLRFSFVWKKLRYSFCRETIQSSGSCVEDDFWDLPIFYRSAVVVAGRVREVEGDFTTGGTLHANLTQPFGAVMGIQTLEE